LSRPCRHWNAEFIRQHLPAEAGVPAAMPAAAIGQTVQAIGKNWVITPF
jgi:hypothetical protein